MNRSVRLFLLLASSATSMACHAGTPFVKTVERQTCGATAYTIESTCQKSDDGGLNTCKPQVLTIASPRRPRKVELPEMSSTVAKRYKRIGGVLSDLYVIRWGCVQSLGRNILVLSYSIGGGSAPYSEAHTKYGEDGMLVGDEVPLNPAALLLLDKSMKAVRSILPE